MVIEAQMYRKYHEGRNWIQGYHVRPSVKHDFAVWFAESDWDDVQVALREFFGGEVK